MLEPNWKSANCLLPAQSSTLSLADVIASIESSNNQFAVRYEAKVTVSRQHSALIAKENLCTIETAFVIAKTSFGLYQIMGSNLYYIGLSGPVGAYFGNVMQQRQTFATFCMQRKIDFTLDEVLDNPESGRFFALHYNGNPVPYLTAIHDRYMMLQDKIDH